MNIQQGLSNVFQNRKTAAVILGGAVLLCGAGAGIWIFAMKGRVDTANREKPVMEGLGENVVSATGLTGTGLIEEELTFDFMDTQLYVKEAFLSVGDEVEAGTAVFEISEDSLKEAERELEKKKTETELAYRQGALDYETKKLDAEKTLEQAMVDDEYSQAVYDNDVSTAAASVSELEGQIAEAQELVEEYTQAVDSNYYYTYYNVEELQKTYYDYFSYLMEIYEKWDVEGLYDQYPNRSSAVSTPGAATVETAASEGEMQPRSQGAQAVTEDESSKLTVYEMFETLVDEYGEEYQTALDQYEADTSKATAALAQAKSNLATLQADLTDAQLEYEKKSIEAKLTKDTAAAEKESAQTVYETELKRLEEELNTLEDARDEALKNKTYFEESIGTGSFYSGSGGVVVMNQVRAGSAVPDAEVLIAYSNPELVTVAANVDQNDIAQITVGEEAYVMISEYGEYDAIVASIEPISSSNSRSSVTYTVNVELQGDTKELENNLTAYVYFGVNSDDMQEKGAVPE